MQPHLKKHWWISGPPLYISSKLSFKKIYYNHTGDLNTPPTEDSKGETTLSAFYWQEKEKAISQ